MEWIETTGATIDEAKDFALDRLGVAEDELEVEVLIEPSKSMFGLKKTEARLKARVRPTTPRPKTERRDRNRRDRNGNPNSHGKNEKTDNKGRKNNQGDQAKKKSEKTEQPDKAEKPKTEDKPKNQRNRQKDRQPAKEKADVEKMDLPTQAEITEDFVGGLLSEMGLDANVVSTIDEDHLTVEAHGLNLGLAIGQQGDTVRAITELARTIIQRRSDGAASGSMIVDIGGYRARRQSFLEEFTRTQAEAVLADGGARSLEPMGSADRRIVHNTVSDIDGLETLSQGSDMNRRVVIQVATN